MHSFAAAMSASVCKSSNVFRKHFNQADGTSLHPCMPAVCLLASVCLARRVLDAIHVTSGANAPGRHPRSIMLVYYVVGLHCGAPVRSFLG